MIAVTATPEVTPLIQSSSISTLLDFDFGRALNKRYWQSFEAIGFSLGGPEKLLRELSATLASGKVTESCAYTSPPGAWPQTILPSRKAL